jgi:hypothetical protein
MPDRQNTLLHLNSPAQRRGAIMNIIVATIQVVLALVCFPPFSSGGALFQENFDNANFTSRGWYDSLGGTISTAEHYSPGASSFECTFTVGATECSEGSPGRHNFTPSNSVYISYWFKHSPNWIGSITAAPSRMFYLLTNLEADDFTGLTFNHLTAYVEENLTFLVLSLQDSMNIDEATEGQNLVSVTENRAVAGCNGTQLGIG